jgi:methylmalonyl-CoA mutase C-terminal domain/subunit
MAPLMIFQRRAAKIRKVFSSANFFCLTLRLHAHFAIFTLFAVQPKPTTTLKNMTRPIRVLIAKAGLDGHDRGAKVIAAALRDAGMEVIYTGLRQTPEMIVQAALQEDVDAIGISILSGAHLTIFPRILALMKEKGLDDVLLTGGGIIPDADILKLQDMGTGKLFTPGAPTSDIVQYIRQWVSERESKQV